MLLVFEIFILQEPENFVRGSECTYGKLYQDMRKKQPEGGCGGPA